MATFGSTGHTVFREGDPAIPDIAAEKRGKVPGHAPRGVDRDDPRRSREGPGIFGRALRALSRRNGRLGAGGYELDESLASGLGEEANCSGMTEREVLEEAVRLYLAGRRGGGEL